MSLDQRDTAILETLDSLDDPNNQLNNTAGFVVDAALKSYRSPFYEGPHVFELVMVPLYVRLGIAVHLVNNELGLEQLEMDGFDDEVVLAFEHWLQNDTLSPKSAPEDSVVWQQTVSGLVLYGYRAVDYRTWA